MGGIESGLINRKYYRAHRANIVYRLKGLEDVIQLVVMGHVLTSEGW